MAETFKLSIYSPDKELFSGEVAEVITEGKDGKVGILSNHIPMIKSLNPTITEFIDSNGTLHRAFTSTGILKVMSGEVLILCEACEWPEDIDLNRAEEAKTRAEERLTKKTDIDIKRAEISLMRSLTRIKIKEM